MESENVAVGNEPEDLVYFDGPVSYFDFEPEEGDLGFRVSLFAPCYGEFTPVLHFTLYDLKTNENVPDTLCLVRELDEYFYTQFCRDEFILGFEGFFIELAELAQGYPGLNFVVHSGIEELATNPELYEDQEFRDFLYLIRAMAKTFNPEPTIH